VAFQDEQQFDTEVRAVCDVAVQRIGELRKFLPNVRAAARALNVQRTTALGWPSYHAGVAAGLAGDAKTAHSRFMRVVGGTSTSSWEEELIRHARDLSELLDDHPAFVERVTNTIVQARALLNLEPAPGLVVA
jgi:hypothetical protein